MFSNTRQYLRCNPVFEAFGFLKLAAEDERVKTRFVDNGHSKIAFHIQGGHFVHLDNLLIFSVYMRSYCFCCIRISQRHSHIFSYKPWFSVFLNTSQISKFWIVEGLTLRSGRRRGCGWCNRGKFIKPLP